jgi:hypothetical protein
VSVLSGGGPSPTGTIDFFLCQPSEVTSGGCEGTAGTKIGATKTLVGGTITSDSTNTTTAIGKYCWRAVYTPATGSPYTGSSHTNALTVASATDTPECFVTLNPTTLLSFSDQIVGLPATATGTVAYSVYNSSDCTNAANLVQDITGTTAVTAGIAPASLSYTPAAPGGTFYVRALFTGNGDFTGVVFDNCTEHVTIAD